MGLTQVWEEELGWDGEEWGGDVRAGEMSATGTAIAAAEVTFLCKC